MAQYDVHRNPSAATAAEFPYLVNVQSDVLRSLETRLVVPLGRRSGDLPPIARLTPEVTVEGESLLFLVNHCASIPRAALGPLVDNLDERRVDLLGAIDFLLSGA